MSRSRSPKGAGDYEVGYGRPPAATRFKKGGIGNPKGRPKRRKTVGQTIQDAMLIRFTIEEKGRPRSVTAQEIIIWNLVKAAARGDTRAIHTLFALRDRYQDSAETTLDPADLEPEDRKIIEEHLAHLQATTRATDTQATNDATGKDNRVDRKDDGN